MEKIECPECGKRFSANEAMEQHRKAKHADERPKKRLNMKRVWIAITLILLVVGIGAFVFLLPSTPTAYVIQKERSNFLGPEDAKVTITEYSDFECPFCGRAEPTVKQVIEKYGDKIRFVYKHFPLRQIHQYAQKAAEANECAADQDKFWEYHDKLFENQNRLYSNALKDNARDLGLNTTAFNNCLDSGIMNSRVQNDLDEGVSRGVRSTPTFFINSKKLEGAQPLSEFERIIDSELSA